MSICERVTDSRSESDVSPDALSCQPMSQAVNPVSAQKFF